MHGSAGPNHPFRLQGRAPGGQADAGERRVSQRGAALRPDERSDVGGPAPGLEGPHDQRAQSAAAAMRRSRCSTSPAAPATSPSAPPRPRAPAFSATVCDINSDMLGGRPRARRRRAISTTRCRSSRAMPRRWRFPIAASTPTPSRSASATCRGSISRCSEAYRVLKPGSRFLCLEFSTVDVPGLDRIYDLFSFKVIPPLGRAVTGDAESYQYLVESIRKFPKPECVRRDDPRRRLFARQAGRASPAASWRCIRAGVCDFCD